MEDVKTYRFNIIKSTIKDLEEDEKRFISKVRKKREVISFYSKVYIVISGFSIVSTNILAIFSNQELLHPDFMVIIISIISTICTTASLFVANFRILAERKRNVYNNLKVFARGQLLKLEAILSDVLEKNDVSNEDFKTILSFKTTYDKSKDQIRKKDNEI